MGVAPTQNRANEIPMVVMADYDVKKDEWRVLREFPRPGVMPRNGLSAFSRPGGILVVGSLGQMVLIKDDGTCAPSAAPPCFESRELRVTRHTRIEAAEFELTLQHFKLRGQEDLSRDRASAGDQAPRRSDLGFVSAASLL